MPLDRLKVDKAASRLNKTFHAGSRYMYVILYVSNLG